MGTSCFRSAPLPCITPDSLDSLQALLADCETATSVLLSSAPAVASLAADLVVRNGDSTRLALTKTASARALLLARKTRALGSVKRVFREQYKGIVAELEAADVSNDQLLVWAAVVGAGTVCPNQNLPLECALAASVLLVSVLLVYPCALQLSEIVLKKFDASLFGAQLGIVATGDGLRVVNASGLGLKWFKTHSRNEFSVVLAPADGSVPVWLTTGDVSGTVQPPSVALAASTLAVTVSCAVVNQGGVLSIAYGGLPEYAPDAMLQLAVCGVVVADAGGGRDWVARVLRWGSTVHNCAALGVHVRTLDGVKSGKLCASIAVSADEKWLVVGLRYESAFTVYSLPGCELVRTFGGCNARPLQLQGVHRLCFAPNGHLIVAGGYSRQLQEVTLEGDFVRLLGVGEFRNGSPSCVAIHDNVIAVGCDGPFTRPHVALFDFGTGAVMSRRFSKGRLGGTCTGIRFSSDGSHVILAELDKRLSVFTTAGVFVRWVGRGLLGGGNIDVLQSVTGEYVVADCDSNRVCVFSADGSTLVRSFGVKGTSDQRLVNPIAVAAAGQHLYVADIRRLHMFK